MIQRDTDLVWLLEKQLLGDTQESLQEIGHVIRVGDGICRVHGLANAVYGELITFSNGGQGIILDLDEDYVSVVLIDNTAHVAERELAYRSGNVLCVPVGQNLLGRVVNALGLPVDGLGPFEAEKQVPIERQAPGINERTPINQSLETGFTVIDTLVPIGKGQRELIIGNRSTGKTSLALDIMLHQKGKNVICIYVSIGHKQANTARILQELERQGAIDYTIIVDADAKETALHQFLSPYTGCTIAEYFMQAGRDVLIIYDDLSNHAIAYRELALLLRRPPGREAYPGDIFYIHSRLLERSGKLSAQYGGGSMTAIPIAMTQGDDISAYIPTNLISITDGQIFLDTQLFNSGVRPAVNIGLSVSRVGGAAQTKAVKKVSGSLKLQLAQYLELLAFAQFGSELDKASQKALERGQRAVECFKQDIGQTFPFVYQTIFLFLLKENYLDKLPLAQVKPFIIQCASYIQSVHQQVYESILTSGDLTVQDTQELKKAADEFTIIFNKG